MKIKNILYTVLGFTLAIPTIGYALSVLTVPQGGTGWGNFTSGTLLTGNGTGALSTTTVGSGLTLSGGTLSTSASAANAFPFTPTSYGNSTSSVIAFLAGLTSNASTTLVGTLNIGTATGQLNVNGGLVYTGATTTFASPLSYSAGQVSCPSCNTSSLSGSGSQGQLTYWTGTNSLGSVATGTVGSSGGITVTASQAVIGSGLTVGCTVATALATGCLTPANWAVLTPKVSTSTSETSGQIAYFSSTSASPATLTGVATGTITGTNGVTVTAGRAAIGGALAIDCTAASITVTGCLTPANWATFNMKVGTSSSETIGNLAYWTSNAASPPTIGSVATGTVSAGSTAITVTANRAAIGGALAIDCATASGSQNGCLSSGDWTTFNGKPNWAFSPTTNFGKLANSTTTQLWLKATPFSLTASSTAVFQYASTSQLTLLGSLYDQNNATGTSGNVLGWSNGGPVWIATSSASGITSLNGLSGASQTFAVDSNNGLINIFSSGTAHTFTGSSTPTFGQLTATSTTALNTIFGNLTVGATTLQNQAIFQISSSSPSFLQMVISNTQQGGGAKSSSDLVFQNASSTNSTYYGNIGLNSPVNTDAAYTLFGAHDMYMYNNDYSLNIGTASSTNSSAALKLFTAGTLAANERARITNTGLFGIGTTSPTQRLSIQGGLLVSGNITSVSSITATNTITSLTSTSTNMNSIFASSTQVSAVSNLYIPSNANPTVSFNGDFSLNNTAASTSIRVHDGTAERAIYTERDYGFGPFSSSTLAYMGSFGTAGTTTVLALNPTRPITMLGFYCKTDVGTVDLNFATPSASTTMAVCTSTGKEVILTTNNTWTMRQNVLVDIGTAASVPNRINITARIRSDAD